ncbi:hypothetical protein U7230_09090 [Carboxydochorda subterranea]|uniref:PorV/PorQ family protein n=1 Tax=Carboxydichorda subterranea TaxID=3109565 RepID=A0ABZ1BTU4_9FIRM|nr:hypothetical protein [Limnochorda sp. L945t]WRP16257.1 hypothetical protein U7230_09090 [Limnochorda sp. L945t]
MRTHDSRQRKGYPAGGPPVAPPATRHAPPVLTAAVLLALAAAMTWPAAARAADYAQTMAAGGIGYSARLLGMAGVSVGLVDETATLFTNPAALALVRRPHVTTLYTRPFGEADHVAVSGGIPGFAAGGSLTTSAVDRTDEYGLPAGGAAGYQELTVALGGAAAVARAAGATLYAGGAARYYRQAVADVQGQAFTADVGLLVEAGAAQVGISRRNLRAGAIGVVRYQDGVEDPLDPATTIGAAVRLGPVLVAGDHGLEDATTRVGAEAWVGQLAVRGGVAFAPGGERQVSLGAGVALGAVKVDYAYLMHPALPDSHRLSLSVDL